MRIVLATDFPVHCLPGMKTGPPGHHATWLAVLAKALDKHTDEFDLHWVTCSKDIAKETTLRAWNQCFHLLPRWKLSFEILTSFRRERSLIANKVAELRPDLFHAWGTEQGYALAATDFAGPAVLSMQGVLSACCSAAPMPLLTRIQAWRERQTLPRLKRITIESQWGCEQIQGLAPDAYIHLIEYGVDPACFTMSRRPDEAPLALAVGFLSPLKGSDTLLAAFSDQRLAGIRLVVLGSIPTGFRGDLPPNIKLLGHRPVAEVREWMARAWCLVHPTRADTSPNSVKEARVIGLPVVTTPNGGQTKYVNHGKSGFIHAAGDIEGLIEGVLSITRDSQTSLRMGAFGQTECRTALDPSRAASNLIERYRD